MSIFNQYFDITKKYRDEYGKHTVLLMQVGGFYEMYGLRNEDGTYIDKYSIIQDICLYCGLKLTDKDATCDNYKGILVMAGFRTYSLDKYVKLIINAGYVCVVFDQDEQKSGTTRSLQCIYTPGTYFDFEETHTTNILTCCWIHKYKNIIVVGASCINVLTGKSYIYEYERLYEISPETFDELERFISTFVPNEIIIIHNIDTHDSSTIIDLINIPQKIRTSIIDISHKLNTPSNSDSMSTNIQEKRAINCSKQIYQDEIYTRFFNTKLTPQTTDMINTYVIASQSYCFLLDYVNQNNPSLITNIELPVFENKGERVVLGNNSLKQLNIIQTHSKNNQQNRYSTSYIESYSADVRPVKKRYTSICDLLNYCKTPMGSRLFYYTMTHPHNNNILLNKIYDTTHYCSQETKTPLFYSICCSLNSVVDIEKIIRKTYINRLSYDDISKMCLTLTELNNIKSVLEANKEDYSKIMEYIFFLSSVSLDNVFEIVSNQQNLFNTIFNVDITRQEITEYLNIFNLGIYPEHDAKVIEYYTSIYQLQIVYYYLIDALKIAEKTNAKNNKEKNYKRDPIKINETERGILTLELTNSRATTLSNYLAREQKKDINTKKLCISTNTSDLHKRALEDKIIPDYLLTDTAFTDKCFSDVYMDTELTFDKSASNGQKTINSPIINKLLKSVYASKIDLELSIKTHFNMFVEEFKKNIKDYDMLIKFCSHIDLLMCYTIVAKNSNYCRPIICDTENSFCDFINIRHPLIEHLLEDELYVANSIKFNILVENNIPDTFNSGQGFLLYGTNTVGKSSFIKSVGIAVIMAQCGFYVAAEKMTYKPYKSVFTRILGNDDLFRGLSTFNVEMLELKNILNYADEHSLVLGDEVCSGTELGSATSIFMSALEYLYNNKTHFIFATHFHNIATCDEMKTLTNMKNIHLSVNYDIEKDKLLYDRKLKEGPGENMYGLEICKSLHLPDVFIKRSYELRNKYFSENSSILDLKSSKYNSKKLVSNCEQCGKKGTEVHHLQYQRNSDEKGYIKNNSLHQYFHKNKKANLMVLCDACHTKLHHDSDSGHYRVSNELKESA
jgi:DNA mismatch repair protein MutS